VKRTMYRVPTALLLAVGWTATAGAADAPGADPAVHAALSDWSAGSAEKRALLDQYCMDCHNSADYAGGIAFDLLALEDLQQDTAVWETVVRKLRAGLMPPKGQPRPARADLDGMVQWLGEGLDLVWQAAPNPGAKPAARLNRTEYRNAVRDLLAFDAGELVRTLPADASTAGFDNVAATLSMSPTLLEGYVGVAMQIARQAVGDPATPPTQVEYRAAGGASQQDYVEGLPLGTRGGLQVAHYFPVDAEYQFEVAANIPEAGRGNDTGRMIWCGGPRLEVLFNGAPLPVTDPQNFRLQVPAGTHTIALALVDQQRCVGAGELLLADAAAGNGSVQGLEIDGPYATTGPGDTPSRRAIFTCQPRETAEERPCATRILTRLATHAYRRPLDASDPAVETLLQYYERGRAADGGTFETGIQSALTWLLVDPRFLYRFEEEPPELTDGQVYAISDLELASRLSFFLWSSLPDEPLLAVAAAGQLHEPAVLASEVERMLADPRAGALLENFAGQWLKLRELDTVAPQDAGFSPALRAAMRQETLLFFQSLARENRNLLSLLDADYTYLNEPLAAHYGIDGVTGGYLRRVPLPADSPRRGLLGQASILTATSVANRTSPVIRGSWIMENLLGARVPPPPPGVETDLDGDKKDSGGQVATLRQRLEQHRADPACSSCHQMMDPVGFALENFDLVGRWRAEDNGVVLDTRAEMVDGTPVDGPATLRAALLDRPEAFMAALTERLLTYALGRTLEPYDGPAVRRIVQQAAAQDFTLTALVKAVVDSAPFRLRSKPPAAAAADAPTVAQQ
jgi:Protein of unknown function (DUF1592)/Protein of unknown function (DUF1588)/Protein of unknown function (DUF1585)/Protein of unknown function (DUF1587)/Protein of unknown function (DUF1595)